MPNLSPEARRLNVLINAVGHNDPLLDQLVRVAAGSASYTMGLNVTLLVDGAVIRGTLARSEEFAEAVDQQVINGMREAPVIGLNDPDRRESIRQAMQKSLAGGILSPRLEQTRKDDATRRERLEAYLVDRPEDERIDLDEVPTQVATDSTIEWAPHAAITLSNSEVHTAGLGWQRCGTIRVVISHVAAWWLTPPG